MHSPIKSIPALENT